MNAKTKWIKPTEMKTDQGLVPRLIPFRRGPGNVFQLPAEGEEVPWDSSPEGLFWKRALNRGEVVEIEPRARPTSRKPGEPVVTSVSASTKPTNKKREQGHE